MMSEGTRALHLDVKKQILVDEAKRLVTHPSEVLDWLETAYNQACRYEYATGQYYSFDPLTVEMQAHVGARRGTLGKCNDKAKWRFGFDESGQLVFAETLNSEADVVGYRHIRNLHNINESATISTNLKRKDHVRVVSITVRDRTDDPWVSATVGIGGHWYVDTFFGGAKPTRIVNTWSNGNSQELEVVWSTGGQPKRIFHAANNVTVWKTPKTTRGDEFDIYSRQLKSSILKVLAETRDVLEFNVVALCLDDMTLLPPTLCVAKVEFDTSFEWADPYSMVGDLTGAEVPALRSLDEAVIFKGEELSRQYADRVDEIEAMLVELARKLSQSCWSQTSTIVFVAMLDRAEWAGDVKRTVPIDIQRAAGISE